MICLKSTFWASIKSDEDQTTFAVSASKSCTVYCTQRPLWTDGLEIFNIFNPLGLVKGFSSCSKRIRPVSKEVDGGRRRKALLIHLHNPTGRRDGQEKQVECQKKGKAGESNQPGESTQRFYPANTTRRQAGAQVAAGRSPGDGDHF